MEEVIALAEGFYGGALRRKGDVFMVTKGETASWFVATKQTNHAPEDASHVDAEVTPKATARKKAD